jgi:hypothetical protein
VLTPYPPPPLKHGTPHPQGVHQEIDLPGAMESLMSANSVLIVPGYGLAVANAQHSIAGAGRGGAGVNEAGGLEPGRGACLEASSCVHCIAHCALTPPVPRPRRTGMLGPLRRALTPTCKAHSVRPPPTSNPHP